MTDLYAELYRQLLELTFDPDDQRLESAMTLIEADVVRVDLASTDRLWRRLHCRDATRRECDLAASSAIIQYVLAEDRPLISDDVTRDPRFADLPCVRLADIRALCCIPIRRHDIGGAVYAHRTRGAVEAYPLELLGRVLTLVAPRLQDLEARPLATRTRAFQRRVMLETLERHGWDIGLAAAELGIGRSTLYKRVVELGLRAVSRSRLDVASAAMPISEVVSK